MKLYQVRDQVYSWPRSTTVARFESTGFTSEAKARRYYRQCVKANAGARFKVALYATTVPDRLSIEDWAQILSDDGIPRVHYELLEQHFGEQAEAA